MVYAIILSICNPLYILKINAEELIISEKPGFSSTFEDEKGNQLTLENFEGNLLLVNLWATWCEPCKDEMPSLELLQNHFNKDNFLVLNGVNHKNTFDEPEHSIDAIINFLQT